MVLWFEINLKHLVDYGCDTLPHGINLSKH